MSDLYSLGFFFVGRKIPKRTHASAQKIINTNTLPAAMAHMELACLFILVANDIFEIRVCGWRCSNTLIIIRAVIIRCQMLTYWKGKQNNSQLSCQLLARSEHKCNRFCLGWRQHRGRILLRLQIPHSQFLLQGDLWHGV